MKITINGREFKKVYKKVARAVSKNSTVSIISGVLIKVTQDALILAATNLQESIESHTEDFQCIEEGSLVIENKILSKIINEIDGKDITIEKTNTRLKIQGQGFNFKIRYQDAAEFPELKEINNDALSINLEAKFMKNAIKTSIIACSTDEARPYLTGVRFSSVENKIIFAALDGFRIAYGYEELEQQIENFSMIIPQDFLKNLSGLLETGTIKMHIGVNNVAFELNDENNTIFVGRLLDGNFPNIELIKNAERKNKLVLHRKELLEALKRANLIATLDGISALQLSITENNLNLKVNNAAGVFEENISTDYNDDELTLGFNVNYLILGLNAFESEYITLNLSNNISPCLITSEEEHYEYLLLPIRLN